MADGEKISGSRAIMRRLDELAPEPRLWPADPERRALVERAEEWGDEVYQPIARRLLWGALRRSPAALVSYADGSRIPLPGPAIRASAAGDRPRARSGSTARPRARSARISAPCPATSTASTAGWPTA